ncbi:MAG: TonB-dependent receptor [Bacteroidales bacterium]|nr:TonB-dependent receptor [Bacteroidales bacterium]
MKKRMFFLALMAILPALVFAQFNLTGKVIEASTQMPLPGAHLTLQGSGIKKVSDVEGNFSFSDLKPGNYRLVVSYIGFEPKTTEVNLEKHLDIKISLSPLSYMSDEVVVKASRVSEKSPATFSIVSRETLNRENTGADLPFLLQSTPSLVVTSDAGAGIGYTGLRIRGTDLSRINVTMNGVPVNDAESHGVFFVNLPDLASSIDNIQIQRGVGTSTNGAATFGASINIKTDARSHEAFGNYSGGAGSFNTFKNTINFGTGVGKSGFSLDGRLSKISSDGYIDRGWSDLKSFYLATSWANEKTLVKLMTTSGNQSSYQAWYGIPKDSLETNRTYNPAGEIINQSGEITGFYDNQTDNYQQDYYQLFIAHQASKNTIINAAFFLTKGQGYYDSWKNNRKFSDYGLPNVVVGNVEVKRTDLIQQKWLDNDFYGFNIAGVYESKRQTVTFGGGWNHYDGDHFGYISWARFSSESLNNTPWYFNKGKKTDYNLFVKTEYQLTERINIYGDIQYRQIDYQMDGTHDDLSDLTQQHKFSFFNPKAGVFYSLSSTKGMYASLAFTNREPNRSVYRDADLNQQITHEKLLNFEAGYKSESKSGRFETNVFYMKYKDQLVLTGKINNVGAPILTNVPDSYRLGWETMFSKNLSKKLTFEGHLSVSENKIQAFTEYVDNWNYWDNPDTEPYQYAFELGKTDISFSPSLVAGFNLNWQAAERLLLSYQSSFVSRQYLDNTSSKDRSLDPYHVGKLLVQTDLPQKIFEKANIQLSMNNLFNAKYETNGWVYKYIFAGEEGLIDGYFPQAGFHWMLQLNLGF